MNKTIIYLFVAVLLAMNVSAVGIGARNEKIVSTGQKTVELFVINNEHKTTEVSIGVLGDSSGVEIITPQLVIESSKEITPFQVNLDFSKIKTYPVKIFVTEIAGNSENTVRGVANAVYKLPIVSQEEIAEVPKQNIIPKDEPKAIIVNSPVEQSFNENEEVILAEKIEKPIAAFSGAVAKEDPVFKLEIPEKDSAKLVFGGILVVVSIFFLGLVFMKKKTPLERYIIASKKLGKTEEEIKSSLKEVGWSDLIIETHIKK